MSPASRRADRFAKRRLYQEAGVETYWVIDPDACRAEVWTPEATFPTAEASVLPWHPAGAAEPFELSLEDLFRPIWLCYAVRYPLSAIRYPHSRFRPPLVRGPVVPPDFSSASPFPFPLFPFPYYPISPA